MGIIYHISWKTIVLGLVMTYVLLAITGSTMILGINTSLKTLSDIFAPLLQ